MTAARKEYLTSKVKLGADASAAAGPKGRTASAATDATMRAEILSYSRARGAFAGVSLEGSTLRPDNDANKKLYGKEVNAEAIVLKGAVKAPPSAKLLLHTLDQRSPHRKTLRPTLRAKQVNRSWTAANQSPSISCECGQELQALSEI